MSNSQLIEQAPKSIDREAGILLRAGVALSAALISLGGFAYLAQNGQTVLNYHRYLGVPGEVKSIPQIFQRVFHGSALATIQCGILVLIAMPITRVLLSVAAFALERDWLYVVISGLVLAVLVYSLLWHLA